MTRRKQKVLAVVIGNQLEGVRGRGFTNNGGEKKGVCVCRYLFLSV